MRCHAMWDDETIVYLPCTCMHATEIRAVLLLVQAETVILWLQLLRAHAP